jgi:hypothetical protein
VNRLPLRPRPTGVTPALVLGDLAMVALCVTAVFWLLQSPLVPITLFSSIAGLVIWTLLLGIPLGFLGVYLNHRAAASSRGPKQVRRRR